MSVKKDLELCFSFKGRLSRKKFILPGLGLFVLLNTFIYFSSILGPLYNNSNSYRKLFFAILLIEVVLVIIIASVSYLSVQARRLHDLGFSGWWLILGVSFSGLAEGISGDHPILSLSSLKISVFFILVLLYLMYFTMLCFFKGVRGENKYGPDPLASS